MADPPPTAPTSAGSALGLGGLVVAALVTWRWSPAHAAALALAALVLRQLAWLYPRPAHRLRAASERRVGQAAAVVARIGGAIGGSSRRRPPRRAADQRRRPGAATLAILVAVVVTWPPVLRYHDPGSPSSDGDRVARPNPLEQGALADQPEAAAVLAQQEAVYATRRTDPELAFTFGRTSDALVAQDGYERRSSSPAGTDPSAVEVWFFGGSVVWGLGQADAETIPSRFAARSAELGLPVRVRNFGAPGYTIDQSSRVLGRLLAEGADPPDLIVFLDGYNEFAEGVASTLAGVAPGTPWAGQLATGSAPGDAYEGPAPTLDERYAGILALHAEGRARAAAAARAAGASLAFFWQPNAHSRAALQPAELEALRAGGWTDRQLRAMRVGDATMRERLPAEVTDLGAIFDEDGAAVYWDNVHLDDHGADVVAAELLERLEPRLREIGAPGR